MSPQSPHSKSNSIQQLTPNEVAGCSGPQGEGGITDPELAVLVAAWPTLPEPIRAGIVAMVRAAAP